MNCKKCPHHVRHGSAAADGRSIEFKDRCGLKMKEQKPVECPHVPFAKGFDYAHCEHYLSTFKTAGQRNDVVPTSDIQYSDKFASTAITEMELL